MFSYNPVRFLIFMLRLCTIVAEFIKVAGIILVGIFSNNKPSVWFMTLSHVLITILSHWWGPQRYNHISVETGGRKDRNYDWSAFTFWKNWLLLNIRAASGRLTVYLRAWLGPILWKDDICLQADDGIENKMDTSRTAYY